MPKQKKHKPKGNSSPPRKVETPPERDDLSSLFEETEKLTLSEVVRSYRSGVEELDQTNMLLDRMQDFRKTLNHVIDKLKEKKKSREEVLTLIVHDWVAALTGHKPGAAEKTSGNASRPVTPSQARTQYSTSSKYRYSAYAEDKGVIIPVGELRKFFQEDSIRIEGALKKRFPSMPKHHVLDLSSLYITEVTSKGGILKEMVTGKAAEWWTEAYRRKNGNYGSKPLPAEFEAFVDEIESIILIYQKGGTPLIKGGDGKKAEEEFDLEDAFTFLATDLYEMAFDAGIEIHDAPDEDTTEVTLTDEEDQEKAEAEARAIAAELWPGMD